MLSLCNGCASPWSTPILFDVSIDITPGEIVSVLGPNGAGKSTLLHVLAGGVALSSGSLSLAEQPLKSWSQLDLAQAVALLPQRSTLAFPFSVAEVVALGRIPHSSGRAADGEIGRAAMRAMDVLDFEQRRYTALSGGEQQRVQLARVLAQLWRNEDSEQRLLLLDEPGNALDLAHLELLTAALRRLVDSGCAVVFVAHDFNFSSALADRAVFLKAGRVIAQGPVNDVFQPEVFEQVFDVRPLVTVHPQSGRPLVFSQ